MKNIFVFCAGNKIARANFRKTILNPVAEELVFSSFPVEKRTELETWHATAGGFYAWGTSSHPRITTMWNSLEVGDCVLSFFNFHYRTISTLVGKAQNSDFAEKAWGGRTLKWNNVIFMSRPKEITIPASQLCPYLPSTYRGSVKVGLERTNSIIRDFGNVQSFIRSHLNV